MGGDADASTAIDAPSAFAARVGERIRSRRKAQGWTVQHLADVSGVSRRMLTQIELGQANPSLGTVDRVAHALSTDFAALTLPDTDATPHGAAPPAAADGTLVWQGRGGSQALLLGVTTAPRAELWRWRLAPGQRYDAEPDQPGAQEIHHVITGTLTLVLSGETISLTAGQSAVISSDQDYAYANDGTSPVDFVRVVTGA